MSMTAERAQYIMDNRVIGGNFRRAFSEFGGITHADGITREEDAFIKSVWEKMPGWTNYSMAVARIAKNEIPE